MKRIISLALCLLLVLSLSVTAFATGGSLVVDGMANGRTYYAYQIFQGTVEGGIITGTEWGSGIAENLKDRLFQDLKNDEYFIENSTTTSTTDGTTLKTEFSNLNTVRDMATKMADWGVDKDRINYFAHFLVHGTKMERGDGTGYLTTDPEKIYTASNTGNTYTFGNLPAGYYLVMDATNSEQIQDGGFYTKFLVSIVEDQEVKMTAKGDAPTVEKKVSIALESGYTTNISDHFNKTHYYEWTGEIPSYIDHYDKYQYVFTDTMSAGLTFERIEQVYISLANGDKIEIVNTLKPAGDSALHAEMMYDQYSVTENADGTTDITLGWEDLKKTYPAIEDTDQIIVRYSAKLNEKAVYAADGNPNTVELKYSNSPNDKDKVGTTPPKTTRVYTFGLDLTKVDSETDKALQGAEFYLYHYHTMNVNGQMKNVPVYAVLDTDLAENDPLYAEYKDTIDVNQPRIVRWVQDTDEDPQEVPGASVLTSDANGKIKVRGLKDNTEYHLHERKAPDTYQPLSNDIKVQITGYTTDANNHEVDSISYKVDDGITQKVESDKADLGYIYMDVDNAKGKSLPSTGGMGTTILYAVGGILVLAAVVMLVTKKRMSNAE